MRIAEAAVQEVIVEGLRLFRAEVLVTSARSVKQGYGADLGIPDLFVWLDVKAAWGGIEVKVPGRVRWSNSKQKELWEAGHSAVATSLEEACYAYWVLNGWAGPGPIFRMAMKVPAWDRGKVIFGH